MKNVMNFGARGDGGTDDTAASNCGMLRCNDSALGAMPTDREYRERQNRGSQERSTFLAIEEHASPIGQIVAGYTCLFP
jgi:hypothetical protein